MLTYTGFVNVGGPPDVNELSNVRITKVAVGWMNNNAYLLRCLSTGQQLLIDAASDPEILLRLIGVDGISAVVTTHQHPDHWGALWPVVYATGARTYAGRYDSYGIPVRTDVLVDDGDTIRFGRIGLSAVHLVGHTPGGIALVYDDPHGHPHVFTGDCLFPNGVGNTHGDPLAFARLIDDVEAKLFARFPDTTWIYPGHGRDTTLGRERPSLTAWRQRGW